MDEDLVFTKRFIDCVQRPHLERNEQDLDFICHTLGKLSEFKEYNSTKLKTVPERLVYEKQSKDHILYDRADKAYCWYYVLSGSVMLSMNYFFSTGSSFGRCVNSDLRADQCHVLEQTELLKINYSEEELKYFSQRAAAKMNHLSKAGGSQDGMEHQKTDIHNGITSSHGSSTKAETTTTPIQNHVCCERPSLENIAGVVLPSPSSSTSSAKDGEVVYRRRRPHQVASTENLTGGRNTPPGEKLKYPRSADMLERNRRSRSEERIVFSFDPADVKSMSNETLDKSMGEEEQRAVSHQRPISSEIIFKRRLSETDKRYSAPLKGNMRDSVGSIDYLSEGPGDSDDEESVQSESSANSMDAVLEVLSKQPSERSQEDVERVMDVLQYTQVFSNMTSNIRRALFQILMVITVDNENTVVIEDQEDVDKWYVVLNGQFKLVRDDEDDKIYCIGDSFGVSQSLKVLPHRGRLVSAEKSCTLCYVSAIDFGRIRTQGEEDLKKEYDEQGQIVAVLEKRSVERKEGYFLIQGTPEKLLEELVSESVDDTFVKDFLLTYRTFLQSPSRIVEKLKETWQQGLPVQKERINTVIQNWVSEHYPDFEGQDKMEGFLDWFEHRLMEDGKTEEKKSLDKSRTTFSRTRSVELDRAGTNSPLEFEVVGGWEVGQPIFVHNVEPQSLPDKAGLRTGDQILEINGSKCDKKDLKSVDSILRKNYKLSLKVRSNLPEYKAYIADPPNPLPSTKSKPVLRAGPMLPHLALSHTHSVDARPMSAPIEADSRPRSFTSLSKGDVGSPKSKKKPKIYQPLHNIGGKLRKLKLSASIKHFSASALDAADSAPGPLKAKTKMAVRKASTENLLDRDKPAGPKRASSLEDIHALSKKQNTEGGGGPPLAGGGAVGKIADAVVKVYLPDHTHKYIDISPTTTIADLIQKGVKEFFPDKFVVSPGDEYCICMVTVTSRNGPIRNSVLPNHMSDLANFIAIESRYYLKERAFHGTLVQDEEAEHIFKESRQWEVFTNLRPKQIAEELTRQDSTVFANIDTSEYIADLWRNPDKIAKENLEKFESIPNDEMYWVVTTVISETRSEIRAKLIKHFIKVAKWCRDLRNFNSMFHIVSGLNHGLVQRQKSTWEKVPHKHRKVMEDMAGFMNPFHNMAKYRELQRSTDPPLIPFFPIIKKDLTFLYEGNETQVGGLVNFEKLRRLSQQIRLIKSFCQRPIMPQPPQLDVNRLGGVLKTIHHSIRMRNRHNPHAMATLTDNALKEVYNHNRMMKMVRKHLSGKYVLLEEDMLERIAESSEKVIMMRKNPPSPMHKGKRKSAHDKFKPLNYSISPSSTTASFGSDTSGPADSGLATPPLSPRRNSAPPPISGLTSDSTDSKSPLSLISTANGTVQVSSH